MKKNRCLSHFQPPDAGYRIGNGTDWGYAEIRFYGKRNTDSHYEKSNKIHRKSYV